MIIQDVLFAVAALATVSGTSRADPIASIDTQRAATPDRIDADRLPLECRQFLTMPANSTSERLAWEQWLSLAACKLARIPPFTDPEKLRDLVAYVDKSAQPSIAIYKDALARGPEQIKMLAAYGLGMAYVNVLVRARNAIPSPPDLMTNLAVANHYRTLHRALEPLLQNYVRDAAVAFGEAARLAAQSPAEASANVVIQDVIASARKSLDELRTN